LGERRGSAAAPAASDAPPGASGSFKNFSDGPFGQHVADALPAYGYPRALLFYRREHKELREKATTD